MAGFAAVAGSLCVFLALAYAVRVRMLRPTEARIRYLSPSRSLSVERSDGVTLLRRAPSGIPALSRVLSASGYSARWAGELERANLTLRPGEYFLARLICAFGIGVIVTLIGRNGLFFVMGLVAAGVGFMLPAYWVKLRIRRRVRAIEAQLVETMSLVSNGLRAGFAFAQSFEVTAQRVGGPMGSEISRMLLDVSLGASLEDALRAMNERVSSDDLDMVVTAILIQRSTGGNLAEVLENVTETMRDRERVHGEIRTLTSQQRLTGWILSVWPIALGAIFFAVNPSMMKLMFTTGVGMVLLGVWAILTTMAMFTFSRILDIDV